MRNFYLVCVISYQYIHVGTTYVSKAKYCIGNFI